MELVSTALLVSWRGEARRKRVEYGASTGAARLGMLMEAVLHSLPAGFLFYLTQPVALAIDGGSMSQPQLTPRVLQWLRGTMSTDILFMILDSGITIQEVRSALGLAESHRETIIAANMIRRHGREYAGRERTLLALECPFITEDEALEWSMPLERARKSEAECHSREGFVYLMRNQRNGLVKIGFSKNPKVREQTLQSEEPEIELIYSKKGTPRYEAELHDEYAAKRVRGEWFSLNGDDVEAIKRK